MQTRLRLGKLYIALGLAIVSSIGWLLAPSSGSVQQSYLDVQLRQEARVLHQSLKEELIKVRSENKRIGGYRNGALITPLNRHVLSRKG